MWNSYRWYNFCKWSNQANIILLIWHHIVFNMITRFSVPNLHECTVNLANIAAHKIAPELVLTNAKVLSTYTDRIIYEKEIWISKGRFVCI